MTRTYIYTKHPSPFLCFADIMLTMLQNCLLAKVELGRFRIVSINASASGPSRPEASRTNATNLVGSVTAS